MSALATRLSSLEKRTAALTFKDVQLPENSANTLTLLKSNSAAKSATANEWILDVFPNFIPILTYVMSLSAQMAQLVDHREHAKTSVATITMYNMAIIYGYFLVSDIFVRPSPSSHSSSWSQTTWKESFVEFLMTLPVPEQLETILQQFAPTVSEHRKNVFFVPSAAGFDHDQHYGRFFPLSFFSSIHDTTATLPGNSPRLSIINDLFPRALYTCNNTTPCFANLLGITIDPANRNCSYVNSKFYQMFHSVFNPVLFRDYQRRSTLATIDLELVTSSNAYDILFSASSSNLRELKVVLQSIASIFDGKVSCKTNLSKLLSNSSGLSILSHGYSTMPLPNWTSDDFSIVDVDDDNTIPRLRPSTETIRSQHLCFLSRPAARPPRSNHIDATALVTDTGAGHPLPDGLHFRNHWPFNLVLNTDSPNPFPTLPSIISFDPDLNVAPRTLVIDALHSPTETAYLATLSGKVIESFELDGCTIEHPREDKSLGMQNALFSDSLIPFEFVMSSFSLGQASATRRSPLARAKADSTQRLPASSLFHDRTKIHLPRLNNDTVAAFADYPGLTPRTTDWISYTLDFFGFRTVSPSNHGPLVDHPPAVTAHSLYIWSPYTYTAYSSSEPTLNNGKLEYDQAVQRTYFLTNLRSIFGTDFPLTEVVHFNEAMPVL
nr:capsid protein [Sarcosphaera coronaria partitivirus]